MKKKEVAVEIETPVAGIGCAWLYIGSASAIADGVPAAREARTIADPKLEAPWA